MRNALWGVLLVAVVWMIGTEASGGRERAAVAAPAATEGAGHELVTLSTPVERGQLLTIVDPRTRAICVYHVEAASGAIALKSVRNIHYDLQMLDYNGVSPLPGELRSMLGQK
jgi:hypothetical protein